MEIVELITLVTVPSTEIWEDFSNICENTTSIMMNSIMTLLKLKMMPNTLVNLMWLYANQTFCAFTTIRTKNF